MRHWSKITMFFLSQKCVFGALSDGNPSEFHLNLWHKKTGVQWLTLSIACDVGFSHFDTIYEHDTQTRQTHI